jgi:hypothetical protein
MNVIGSYRYAAVRELRSILAKQTRLNECRILLDRLDDTQLVGERARTKASRGLGRMTTLSRVSL